MKAPKTWKSSVLPLSGMIPVGSLQGLTVLEGLDVDPAIVQSLVTNEWIRLTNDAAVELQFALGYEDEEGDSSQDIW